MKKKVNTSKLIKKSRGCIVTEGNKYITVSVANKDRKYGYENMYIPNTIENRMLVRTLKGAPSETEVVRGKKRDIFY